MGPDTLVQEAISPAAVTSARRLPIAPLAAGGPVALHLPVSVGHESTSAEERQRMSDPHADRVDFAVCPQSPRHLGVFAMIGQIVSPGFHLPAHRVAANTKRDDPEGGKVRERDDKKQSSNPAGPKQA